MVEKKDIVFVKFGGAAITFKDIPRKPNIEVIEQMSKEISDIYDEYRLLIGNGGGSFAHPIASQYKVQEGLNVCGKEGFSKTHDAAKDLNDLVVESLIKQNIPVLSFQTSAATIAQGGEIQKMFTHPIKNMLNNDFIPVIYGDVVVDEINGCTIVSTEQIFKYLGREFKPKRIIIATDVDGVYTSDPKKGNAELISKITQDNIKDVVEGLGGSLETDVTGGMAHKVEELYNLSKLNICVEIINGLKENYLKRAIKGEEGLGTSISVYSDD